MLRKKRKYTNTLCVITGCGKGAEARGMCKRHYNIDYCRKYIAANPERNRERVKKWQRDFPEKMGAKGKIYRSKFPEKEKSRAKKYHLAHINERHQYSAAYAIANRDKLSAKSARRRALKLKATPIWANEFFIEEIYNLAKLRTRHLNFPWHVDHIVPLQSNKVCGLHVEHNLQVIPGMDNFSKNNRHWPDMP